jgi:predicted CDP-diglyceride synthetase/phosphatidate cytidylyltransferase
VKRLNLDLFFHLVLLALFIILMWESRLYPPESSFYPRIVGGITIILLLVSLVRHFRKKEEEKKTGTESTVRLRRFFQISLVIVLATVLGFLGGFILSVLCYYVAYALFQEERTRLIRTLGIGVALTVLFYISFGWFMQVPLLRGWLVDF